MIVTVYFQQCRFKITIMDDRTNIPDDVKMVDKLNKNDKTKSSVKNEEETEDVSYLYALKSQ